MNLDDLAEMAEEIRDLAARAELRMDRDDHAGYMMLGASLVTVAGLTAGIVHIFNHAVMKAALFLALFEQRIVALQTPPRTYAPVDRRLQAPGPPSARRKSHRSWIRHEASLKGYPWR